LLKVDTKLLDTSIILTTTILFWITGRLLYEIYKLYLAQHISILIAFISVFYYRQYGTFTDILQFSYLQSWKIYLAYNSNGIFIVWAIHKMILGFLLYQFIIALKRQTKR
jgi:hypothetical protein